MTNVIRLFSRKKVELVPPEPETSIVAAVTTVLALNEQLSQKVKELSGHFDSIENAIDRVDDTATRTRLRETTKLSREALSAAVSELTRQIATLVGRLGA
jgi:methyl-accepting chemotaxis protein